jgi:hypothetical protein
MPDMIEQGVDCYIDAFGITDPETGTALNVTGCAVHAVARAVYGSGLAEHRRLRFSPVIAEWHTTPITGQGQITAGGAVTNRVRIFVTPEQTQGWRCNRVIIQAHMLNPSTSKKARIVNKVFEVSFSGDVPQ